MTDDVGHVSPASERCRHKFGGFENHSVDGPVGRGSNGVVYQVRPAGEVGCELVFEPRIPESSTGSVTSVRKFPFGPVGALFCGGVRAPIGSPERTGQ